ncbi:hypothetical protein RP20_CCG006742 [Aedes albopictus]|nr:hypothetical protein RP20_CCG006742 [Aedes albopictus]
MVKEKPNSTRIYDKDGYRRRAACICVRSEAEAEILNRPGINTASHHGFP